MENKINKIINLNDDTKFLIMDQGFLEGKDYFFVSKLDKDNNLTKEFSIFEHTTKNGKNTVQTINLKEKKLLQLFSLKELKKDIYNFMELEC